MIWMKRLVCPKNSRNYPMLSERLGDDDAAVKIKGTALQTARNGVF